MRYPSIATLSNVFKEPEEARKVFEMTRCQLKTTEAGRQLVRNCFTPPSDVYLLMTVLNALESGLQGVESLLSEQGVCVYLNTGDSYAATVIFWQRFYRVQCLADFIFTQERRGIRFRGWRSV